MLELLSSHNQSTRLNERWDVVDGLLFSWTYLLPMEYREQPWVSSILTVDEINGDDSSFCSSSEFILILIIKSKFIRRLLVSFQRVTVSLYLVQRNSGIPTHLTFIFYLLSLLPCLRKGSLDNVSRRSESTDTSLTSELPHSLFLI